MWACIERIIAVRQRHTRDGDNNDFSQHIFISGEFCGRSGNVASGDSPPRKRMRKKKKRMEDQLEEIV